MPRVLIVGGGTGGTMLANKLGRNKSFDVTLLSASPDHMFQPALLYVAFAHGSANIVRNERSLLSRRVRFVQDKVTLVNLRDRVVETESGTRYEYDSIVLATGANTDVSQIPGLPEVNAQFGDYHSSIAQAKKVWVSLDAFKGGTLALGQASPICVCPPSPIEGILLADRLLRKKGLRGKSRLIFFTPYPRPYPAEPMSEIIEPIVKERGIEIMTFFDVDRIDPAKRTITSIEGDTIECDLPIIIPPFVGANIAFEPASVLDPDRFIITDKETLHVKGFDTAYAIGDGANLPTSKAGVGAHLEAEVVGKQLAGGAATFDGRTHCPVDLGDGTGTFVIGSYAAPVVKKRPSRLNHLMKVMFGRFYWITLSGLLDPMLDIFFMLTKPRPRAAPRRPEVQQT
jgi:sulfide:quinone oxidoreductase